MKREGVCTRSQTKKQKLWTAWRGNLLPDNPFEEEFGSSSDSGQGVWTELSKEVASNLAGTVVSLASFADEKTVFFACTGIIIVNNPTFTSFLTSLSLVRSIDDDTKVLYDMPIEVRLPDNKLELGWLEFYDLEHNVAVINIFRCHSLQVACLDHQHQFESHSKVVAVGRCFNSGKLMATVGMLTDNPKGAYREELAISTCEITMTGVGGPLVDFNGDFIGMNFYAEKETPFLPRIKILELLSQFRKSIQWMDTDKKGPGSKIEIFPRPCKPDSEGNSLLDNPFGEEFGSSSDSGQGVWTELSEQVASNLTDTVVSLASFADEKTVFFACTGIIIVNNPTITSFLTSLSLVRSINDDTKILHDMKIEVRLPDNQHKPGWLEFYDLKYNVAVINIFRCHSLQVARLDHQRQFESHSKVVAVGRCFKSGKLMATTGMLTDNRKGAYREELAISTCEITMTGVGGPLVDFNGDFIGMNFYAEKETPFLPRNKILELLSQFSKITLSWATSKKGPDIKIERFPRPKSDSKVSSRKGEKLKHQKPSICTLCDPECQPGLMDRLLLERKSLCSGRPGYPYFGVATKKELRSNGYPLPVWNDGGNRLLNNFEEKFSEDIWSKLERNVASNMSQSVVALASFSGRTRCCACTGIFIDCSGSTTRVLTSASLVRASDNENKVADNLKIVVCLPDNRHTRGTLQHYSLHYNIAVVHIKNFCCTQTAQIHNQMLNKPQKEVVAIGRVYQSGNLMATSGIVIDKPSKLDCKELKISTCKITKAGIGGPLIDLDGNFIGMNFYGLEEAPYIPVNIILEVLKNFDAQGTVARDDDDSPNRWPVPRPFWCYPMWHEIEEEVDLEEEIKYQRRQLY